MSYGGGGGGSRPYYGTVRKANNQSIPSGVATKITFSTVVQNPYSLWNVANNRFILNQIGVWLVMVNMPLSGDASVVGIDWNAYLYRNGVQLEDFRDGGGPSGYQEYINVGFTYPVVVTAVTDYVEVFARQNSGGAVPLYAPAQFSVLYEGIA